MESQIQRVQAWQHVSQHEESILQIGTVKMILTQVCNKLFTVIFLDRSDWKGKFPLDRNVKMVWFREKRRHLGWGVWIWYQEEA
jgi:hypothetical protein